MTIKHIIQENTKVMRQLIAVLQSNSMINNHEINKNANELHRLNIDDIDKENPSTFQDKTSLIDINTLDLKQTIALSVLFKGNFEQLTTNHTNAIKQLLTEHDSELKRLVDALYMTLVNLEPVTNLPNSAIHNICIEIISNWDNLHGIASLCEFTLSLIKSGKITANQAKRTDPNVLFTQAEQLILQLAQNGYRNDAVNLLNQYGAKKLGQVSIDHLPDIIRLAKKKLAK